MGNESNVKLRVLRLNSKVRNLGLTNEELGMKHHKIRVFRLWILKVDSAMYISHYKLLRSRISSVVTVQ